MRFTIKMKILGLAGGLLAAMALTASLGISSLNDVNAKAQESYATTTRPLAAIGVAWAHANADRALLSNHLMASSAAERASEEREIRAGDRVIAASLVIPRRTLRTAQGRRSLQQLEAALAAYRTQRDRLLARSRSGVAVASLAADNARHVRPRFAAVTAAFTSFYDAKVKLAIAQNAGIDATHRSRRQLSLLLLALALALGGAASWWIARQITRGAGQMLSAARAISRGELDQTVSITTQDELGETGAAFESMIDYLRETADAARRVGAGDLTAAIEPRSERDALRTAFVEMRSGLSDLVGELRHSADTVSSASQQLSSTSEETSRAVTEIATAIEDVAVGAEDQVRQVGAADDAIREVAAAADASARSAEATALLAESTMATAREGVAAAASATDAMEAVRVSADTAAGAIGDLADRSRRIGDVIDTITGIAEQTNLLALNAAIEAARAGEQGRGFAVVADHVRQLAENSAAAARTISTLIVEIQRETERTVTLVREGAERTAAGSRTVGEALDAFSRIEVSVTELARRSADIAASATQIRARTGDVLAGIGNIARVAESSSASAEQVSASTQETSASTQQISASAEELSATAGLLERLVGRFTV